MFPMFSYRFIILILVFNVASGYVTMLQNWKANYHDNSRLEITTALSSSSTMDVFLREIKRDPDPKKFMKMFNIIAGSERNELSEQQKKTLLAEIDMRYSQLDFSLLIECLHLIGTLNLSQDDDGVSELIEDVINSLASESSLQSDGATTKIIGISSISISGLLHGLVGTKLRWKDLSSGAGDMLQRRIQATVFLDPSLNEFLPDIISNLGKLSADFRVLNPSFKSSLMDAINNIDGKTGSGNFQSSHTPNIAKLLGGLSQMKPCYASDISDLTKVTLNALLCRYGSSMTEIEIANSIHALGKMECPWSSLGKKNQKMLLLNVLRAIPIMAAPALSNTIW